MTQETLEDEQGTWDKCKCSRWKRPEMKICFACEQWEKYEKNPEKYGFCRMCSYFGRTPLPVEKDRLDNGVCWDCSSEYTEMMSEW